MARLVIVLPTRWELCLPFLSVCLSILCMSLSVPSAGGGSWCTQQEDEFNKCWRTRKKELVQQCSFDLTFYSYRILSPIIPDRLPSPTGAKSSDRKSANSITLTAASSFSIKFPQSLFNNDFFFFFSSSPSAFSLSSYYLQSSSG